jgi:hypothetical protein
MKYLISTLFIFGLFFSVASAQNETVNEPINEPVEDPINAVNAVNNSNVTQTNEPFANTNDGFGLDFIDTTGLGDEDLRVVLMTLIRLVLSFVGVIALIMFLWAGFTILISGGNDEKRAQGFRTLWGAIIGLVIIFFSYSIVTTVIQNLQEATGA